MAEKLTALGVKNEKRPGVYADTEAPGLRLQVSEKGTKSWIYRFSIGGRTREMGLGAYPEISLADARRKAGECRGMVLQGHDPIEARAALRAAAVKATAHTFKAVALEYVEAKEAGFRNLKHRQQWRNTLVTYAFPVIGSVDVADVTTEAVGRLLKPIWTTKNETASRVRGRIEAVLDYAKAMKWRDGENAAAWKGNLKHMLPDPAKVKTVTHHAALPWQEIGAFMATLRTKEVISSKGLQFLILTACRTGEVIGARWEEIDLTAGVWTIPAARMKAGVEHRVPLSAPALALLKGLPRGGEWVSPGGRKGKPLSNMAFLELLKGMGRGDITPHGFRSTFRDWCGEATGYPRDVAEAALAHTNKDKVEAAYRRGDLIEKRRVMMEDWATYCGRVPEVVSIHKYAVGQ